MRATLSFDRTTVTLAGRVWSTTFPVSEIDRQLAFYRGLSERRHGAYADCFAGTISSLEGVMRRTRESAANAAPYPHQEKEAG